MTIFIELRDAATKGELSTVCLIMERADFAFNQNTVNALLTGLACLFFNRGEYFTEGETTADDAIEQYRLSLLCMEQISPKDGHYEFLTMIAQKIANRYITKGQFEKAERYLNQANIYSKDIQDASEKEWQQKDIQSSLEDINAALLAQQLQQTEISEENTPVTAAASASSSDSPAQAEVPILAPTPKETAERIFLRAEKPIILSKMVRLLNEPDFIWNNEKKHLLKRALAINEFKFFCKAPSDVSLLEAIKCLRSIADTALIDGFYLVKCMLELYKFHAKKISNPEDSWLTNAIALCTSLQEKHGEQGCITELLEKIRKQQQKHSKTLSSSSSFSASASAAGAFTNRTSEESMHPALPLESSKAYASSAALINSVDPLFSSAAATKVSAPVCEIHQKRIIEIVVDDSQPVDVTYPPQQKRLKTQEAPSIYPPPFFTPLNLAPFIAPTAPGEPLFTPGKSSHSP